MIRINEISGFEYMSESDSEMQGIDDAYANDGRAQSIFDKKPDVSGLSSEEAAKVMKKYKDDMSYSSYQERQKIIDDYKAKHGVNPLNTLFANEQDVAYDYVNENKGAKAPQSQIYEVTFDSKYEDVQMNGKNKTIFNRVYSVGQVAIEGNNVPIENTFTAYLLNNNEKSTAKIGNTSPEVLAERFLTAADNINEFDAPNIQRVKEKDGEKMVAYEKNGSGKTKLMELYSQGYTQGDKVLNDAELNTAKRAYTFEAGSITAAADMNNVKGESGKRVSSASTVDIDSSDPYDMFFKKVGQIDGKPGVTKEELAKGIEAISEKTKDGGLSFSNDKLNKFIKGQ